MNATLLDLTGYFARFVLILPAIIVHEVSHGYAAFLLGDDTAKRAGRLTLNPIKHIDVFGTLLLPALLIVSGSGVVFGYAKPVPIGTYNFKDRRTGMLLTGIAGPLSNIAMAAAAGLPLRFMHAPERLSLFDATQVYSLLATFAFLNVMLACFNLIPIPPLDGSRVVAWFLSGPAERAYVAIERYGFIILFAVLFLLPAVVEWYLSVTALPLFHLVTGLSVG